MSDTPDVPLDDRFDDDLAAIAAEEASEQEPLVITGVLNLELPGDIPSIDDVLAGNVDVDDDELHDDDDDLDDAVAAHPAGRFPDENVGERVDGPASTRYETPPDHDHVPASAGETDTERDHRLAKESMSRQERRRRGW